MKKVCYVIQKYNIIIIIPKQSVASSLYSCSFNVSLTDFFLAESTLANFPAFSQSPHSFSFSTFVSEEELCR